MLCCRVVEYSLGWRAFGLYTGRGISEGDIIYLLYTAAVHMWLVIYRMVQNYSYKCRKRAYKGIIGKMVFLLVDVRNCAYRGKYAVIKPVYSVW